MMVRFKSLACRLLDLYHFGKDQVCSSLKCHFNHILCSHLHYSQVNMKAEGIYSNDKAVLNVSVAKIFIADERQFGLYKVQRNL